MTTVNCYGCHSPVDVHEDEWWSHSWEENPSEENVVKAIEETEFRDWFRKNIVLCRPCHKELIESLRNIQAENGLVDLAAVDLQAEPS